MNLRHMMFCRTISYVWKLPEVKAKHCGLVPLTQSKADACDRENFVENWIGHDRYNNVTFWRVKMQIWVIYGILLVNECCGTLGTAVNEAHVTEMTP